MQQPLLYISEQHNGRILDNLSDEQKLFISENNSPKYYPHDNEKLCYHFFTKENQYFVNTTYFIGVDWIVPEKAALYIEPKLNDNDQVDFLNMLMESLASTENIDHLEGLFHTDFDEPWISIPQQKDRLSPILIVQFLRQVQKIVRKGLKKSYYRITENLNSRIKGKILIDQQIKQNIVKNRLTQTICNYQEFGINTKENQYLKLVLEFVSAYLYQSNSFFSKEQAVQLQNILHYCLPSFESVDLPANKHQIIHLHKNPFYKEYEEAIKIGGYILKRFSFNINKTSESQTLTPPFWLDMSKLFELYVFNKLRTQFTHPDDISYHDTYAGGKETDILIKAEGFKCVVDCKYKPRYENGPPSLQDKRQLAGYTRLKSVYNKLDIPYEKLVKGLIIYCHQSCKPEILKEELLIKENAIEEYIEFYKLGVSLPEIKK